MSGKILVTPRSLSKGGHPLLQPLEDAGYDLIYGPAGKQPSEEELRQLLPDCVGYLAGVEPVTAHALKTANILQVISRNGTGVDNLDLDYAAQRGIVICRAEGANARGVAELTLGHILAAARALPQSHMELKQRRWERQRGIELYGRTLGLAGCGRVGQLVVDYALALGMRVIAFDPFPARQFQPDGDFSYVSKEQLFREADILSLHCPPTEDGSPLVDPSALAEMKPGAILINTARASLLDAEAVLSALDSGHLAALTLDAFDQEPPTDRRLLDHPRVIATPHLGGYTQESIDRATAAAVRNLLNTLQKPGCH